MKPKIKWKPLLLALALPLAVGGFSAFLTRDGMRAFASLRQMVDVERVSAILSLRAVIQKMTLPLSIADLT